MRVWFSKIHCPSFVCFCKPAQHLYAPSPLKLDSAPHVHPPVVNPVSAASVVVVDDESDHVSSKNEVVVVGGGEKVGESELVLRSIIKRKVSLEGEVEVVGRKKTVQWMDVVGKELVDVKEFETSETEDTDSEGEYNRGCICAIL